MPRRTACTLRGKSEHFPLVQDLQHVAHGRHVKTLPADRTKKILGVSNRWFVAVCGSVFCVVVELFLNAIGALTWDYWWWNVRTPWLIFLFGYLTFFIVSFWVHDMPSIRQKAATVGAIFAFDLVCLAVFAGTLKWI